MKIQQQGEINMAAEMGGKMAAQLRESYMEMGAEDLLYLRAQGTLTETAEAVLEEVLKAKGVDPEQAETIEAGFRQEVQNKKAVEKRLASIASRLSAKVIDWIFIFLLIGMLGAGLQSLFPEHKDAISMILGLVLILYLLFKDGVGGQSIGKRLVKVKVVHTTNGRACTLTQSFFRNLSTVLGLVDSIFALGKERRRLGDLIAGTRVIKTKSVG
jgi:uncharacterized RDD family membrane protein YckC